jgi:hypothetical protein
LFSASAEPGVFLAASDRLHEPSSGDFQMKRILLVPLLLTGRASRLATSPAPTAPTLIELCPQLAEKSPAA